MVESRKMSFFSLSGLRSATFQFTDKHTTQCQHRHANTPVVYIEEQQEFSGKGNECSGLFQFSAGDISIRPSATAAVKHEGGIKAGLLEG